MCSDGWLISKHQCLIVSSVLVMSNLELLNSTGFLAFDLVEEGVNRN
jgi:hypothetical protein